VPPRRPSHLPRKQPRQRRAQVTVEAIVEAAGLALERDGLDGLTTTGIAELAGVSVGTLYQYFPDREAILGALVERQHERTHAAFRALLTTVADVPLRDAVDQMLARLLRVFVEHAPFAGPLQHAISLSGREDAHRSTLARYVADLAPHLAARRDVTVADPEHAAWLIVHAADGAIRGLALAHPVRDPASLLREARRMLCTYLTA